MEQKNANNDLHPSKKLKKMDQSENDVNPKDEDQQSQQSDPSSTLSQHIGIHTIYIQESPYGFRHSKYAAEYRREWQKMSQPNEEEKMLAFQRNVATIKLVRNPSELEDEPYPPNYGMAFLDGAKKQEDPEEKAVYVTMPSLTKLGKQDKSAKSKFELADAGYHSEPQVGKALIFGHNKGLFLEAKDKIGNDRMEIEYNKITENGKYIIKWVYSEREPCLPGLYKGSCQEYLEGLAKVQFEKWQLPIEVYYTNAYHLNAFKKYKADKINTTQVTDSKDHPLSSDASIHQERQKDLRNDIHLGKTVLYTPTISEDDLQFQQQQKKQEIKRLEVQLDKAKDMWKTEFKKQCNSYLIEQLKKANINHEEVTFADRGKVYQCDSYTQAMLTSYDKAIENIEKKLQILTGERKEDSQIDKNKERLMNALKEEKDHETITGLKDLEREIKVKIATVMKDGGNKNFIAEGQKLLSQINNTICEYRHCRKTGAQLPVEDKLKEYKNSKEKLFERLKPKEHMPVETKANNADLNSDDKKHDDHDNKSSLTCS